MTEIHPLARACTFLFAPGHRPERFEKALHSGADAVILDLEDAVPLSEKDAARDAIRRELVPFLKQCPERIVLRVNACGTPYLEDDLRLVDELGIRHLMLPKAESAAQLTSVGQALSFTPVLIPMIESAKGVDQVKAIAAHPHTLRLSLGNIDLQLSLGLQCGPDELELLPVRHQILLASRLHEIAAPIDGVTVSSCPSTWNGALASAISLVARWAAPATSSDAERYALLASSDSMTRSGVICSCSAISSTVGERPSSFINWSTLSFTEARMSLARRGTCTLHV